MQYWTDTAMKNGTKTENLEQKDTTSNGMLIDLTYEETVFDKQ